MERDFKVQFGYNELLQLQHLFNLGGDLPDYVADLRKRANDSWRDSGERQSAERDLRDLQLAIVSITGALRG